VVRTENVTQAMVGKNGKADYREESVSIISFRPMPTPDH
jgi:hypothetical protein